MQPPMSLLEVESNHSRTLQDADSRRVSWHVKGTWFLQGVGLACLTLIGVAAWQQGMPNASSDLAKSSQHVSAVAFDNAWDAADQPGAFDKKTSNKKVKDPAAFNPATVALEPKTANQRLSDRKDFAGVQGTTMKISGDYAQKNAKRDALTLRLWEERQQMKRGTSSPVLGGDLGTATIKKTETMPKPYDFKIEQRFAAAAAATMLLIGVANPLPALATGGDNPNSVTAQSRSSLTYDEIKGTGLANRCSLVKTPVDPSTGVAGVRQSTITVKSGAKLVDFCLEPKQFFVEEEVATKKGAVETKYVPTKLMTRQTYTLDGITGTYSQKDGKLQFKEEDGIDYAPTTVQMPGGERVPFLFTVKELLATGAKAGYDVKPGYEFGGKFAVPSYRSGLFLDPKGRGMTTGYDMAQALTGLQTGNDGDLRLENENNKKFDNLQGSVEFEVQSVDATLGEFGGVFVSTQPGDTDQGTQKPKKILLKGVFYGKIEPEGSVNR